MMRKWNAIVLVASILVAVASCKKPPTTTPVTAPAPSEPTTLSTPPEPPQKTVTETFPSQPVEKAPMADASIEELNRQGVLKTVYFDLDASDLSDASRQVLVANADWLRGHGTMKVRVEGHCDERGTVEYNLSLGERRAAAVRDYLVSLGIDAGKIRIVSYGKERPADPGHNDSAWAKNRRAEFFLE